MAARFFHVAGCQCYGCGTGNNVSGIFQRVAGTRWAPEPIVINGVTWVAPNKWPKTNG